MNFTLKARDTEELRISDTEKHTQLPIEGRTKRSKNGWSVTSEEVTIKI